MTNLRYLVGIGGVVVPGEGSVAEVSAGGMTNRMLGVASLRSGDHDSLFSKV